MSGQDKPPPTKFGVVLFPGFQALDVFGPLDVLNNLSRTTPLEFARSRRDAGPRGHEGRESRVHRLRPW